MVLKKGLELLSEQPGEGSPVRKQCFLPNQTPTVAAPRRPSPVGKALGASRRGCSTRRRRHGSHHRRANRPSLSVRRPVLRNSGNECRRNTAAADCSTPRVRRAGGPRDHSAECHPYGGAFSHRRAKRRPVAMSEWHGQILGIGSIWRPSGPPTFAHACQRERELRLASHAKVVHRSGEAAKVDGPHATRRLSA